MRNRRFVLGMAVSAGNRMALWSEWATAAALLASVGLIIVSPSVRAVLWLVPLMLVYGPLRVWFVGVYCVAEEKSCVIEWRDSGTQAIVPYRSIKRLVFIIREFQQGILAFELEHKSVVVSWGAPMGAATAEKVVRAMRARSAKIPELEFYRVPKRPRTSIFRKKSKAS